MRAARFSSLVPLVLVLSLSAPAQTESVIVLEKAHIIDATGRAPYEGTVFVRDGRIDRIEKGWSARVPAGTRVIDLGGRHYLLPGFIDAHVHINTAEEARRALNSGVTTVRSMGVANYADVGLRQLIRSGLVEGPEIVAAGYHIRPSIAESFFFHSPDLGYLMNGVRGAENFRKVTLANIRREVDFIKVVATDRAGLPDTDPRRQIMTEEELVAIVRAAEMEGLPVAAHAHGDEGGRAAVEAGVRSIEHGTYLSEATLRLMKERGAYLVPTVAVVRDLTQPGGDYDNPVLRVRGRHMLPRIQKTVAMAYELGVPIVAATDTGYGPRSLVRMAHDVKELVGCGISASNAIRSATATAAELLGIEDRTGTIQVGREADLIVVEGNPLEDIVVLQDVLLVISDGQVQLDRLSKSEN